MRSIVVVLTSVVYLLDKISQMHAILICKIGSIESVIYVCRDVFGESWDRKKTLKQNLASFGLAYDSNTALPLRTEQQTKVLSVSQG